MYEYKARVVRVVDGDTVVMSISLGCHVVVEKYIRLYGINAPEMHGATKLAGMEARDFLSSHVLGKELLIQTFKDKTEKYGRLLAKIYTDLEKTECVNDLLISSGHAVAYLE